MTQRRLADPLYIYADPMKGAAHQPPAAAVIAGAAASTFLAGTTILGLSAFGSFLALSAIGLALNALAPKPPRPQRGYALTQFGPAQDHQVVYGESRVAGVRVFDSTSGKKNKFLHRVIAIAGHEIEEYTEVWLNDYLLSITGKDSWATSTGSITGLSTGVVVGLYELLELATDQGNLLYERVLTGGQVTFQPVPGVASTFLSTLYRPVFGEGDDELDLVGPAPLVIISGFVKRFLPGGGFDTIAVDSPGGARQLPAGGAVRGARRVGEDGSIESTSRYNDKVEVYFRYGTDNQTAIPQLVSRVDEWTSAHRLRGIAYIYIQYEFDADVFPNGVPEISVTVRGKRVYDPRTDEVAWSNNPALCLRDYLTSPRYGMAATVDEIDDVLVAQAANVCDETVIGTNLDNENIVEKRYTLNGAFTTDVAPADILSSMLSSMGGLLWHAQGAWRMKPAYYTAPVLELTQDDLRSGLQIQTRMARRDAYNTVRGTFRGPETDWQVTDYKPVSDPAFVAADGGFDTPIDLDLPYTSSHFMAQRIARIALQQQREQITVTGRFGLRAFQVQVGDNVTLTNPRIGWESKEFEVVSWTFALTEDLALEVLMTLRETSEQVFVPTPGEFFESNNTELPSAFINVAPENLDVTSVAFIAADGTYVNSVNVTWDEPDDAFVDFYEVEWRKTTVTEFSGATTSATEFVIPSIDEDASYVVRVRAVNVLGVRGPFVTETFNSGPDITPPNDPTSLGAAGVFKGILITWVNPPDRDFDYIEVWESANNNFGDASLLAIAYGSSFTRANLEIGVERYYWIRAVDATGNQSGFAGPVNATAAAIDAGTDIAGDVAQLFQDAGIVGVEVLDELPTVGNFTGRTVYLTTDNTLYQWDGSAWQDIDASVAPGSITATEIADNAITTPKLNAQAVTTAKIQANAITAGLIAAGAVTADKINVNQLSAIAAQIGLFQSAASGERIEIEDDRIRVFDSSDQVRVIIGNLD